MTEHKAIDKMGGICDCRLLWTLFRMHLIVSQSVASIEFIGFAVCLAFLHVLQLTLLMWYADKEMSVLFITKRRRRRVNRWIFCIYSTAKLYLVVRAPLWFSSSFSSRCRSRCVQIFIETSERASARARKSTKANLLCSVIDFGP